MEEIINNRGDYDWVGYYKEFAEKLLDYKDDRGRLIEIIREVYKEIDIKLPKLEIDNEIVDMDPFTVFGLFNKQITEENRIKIISKFKEKMNIESDIPKNFDSVPVLNNMNATYYRFRDKRGEDDIDRLWNLFEAALAYSSSQNDRNRQEVKKYFDLVIKQWGIGNSKLTMGLYWIDPHTFLNLDSRNEWYIWESGNLDEALIDSLPKIDEKMSAETYFKIKENISDYIYKEQIDSKSLPELSYNAWKESKKENENRIRLARDSKGEGLPDKDVESVHYWIYSPGRNANKWDQYYEEGLMGIGWGELGDLKDFSSKEDIVDELQRINKSKSSYMNDSLAIWEFANEMKLGDIIFVKRGRDKVVGRGVVSSNYSYDATRLDSYKNIRRIDWTDKGEWEHPGSAPLKTLTDITSYTEYVEDLNSLFNDEIEETSYPKYDDQDFLEEVFMNNEEDYYTLKALLERKKNLILEGAPGVGKTYMAKRLAYSLMGEKDQDRVEMIQFHQSYSYEDFIEGYRPTADGKGFERKKGPFYRFCKKAGKDLENKYYFIIDEINRGNLSKIFGELFMLIENDKRGNSLKLLYSDEKFSVPENVHIIGMMNTADRSLAMLDYALRRRFVFYNLEPVFESEDFKKYMNDLGDPKFDSLIYEIISLNKAIEEDQSLGRGFQIGHSYFTNLKSTDTGEVEMIVEYEILPLIREYWFDEPRKLEDWEARLRGSIR